MKRLFLILISSLFLVALTSCHKIVSYAYFNQISYTNATEHTIDIYIEDGFYSIHNKGAIYEFSLLPGENKLFQVGDDSAPGFDFQKSVITFDGMFSYECYGFNEYDYNNLNYPRCYNVDFKGKGMNLRVYSYTFTEEDYQHAVKVSLQ